MEGRLSIPIPFHVCRSTFRKWEVEIDMRPRAAELRKEGRTTTEVGGGQRTTTLKASFVAQNRSGET